MPAPPSTSSRPGLGEWTQTVLLVASLAWTTLGLGGYLPGTMIVTSALNALLLAAHALDRAFARAPRPPLHPAGWLLVPFLLYGVGNVLGVTPVPWLGWHDWLGWAQMILVFWVVLNGIRSRAPRAALFGALLALATVAVALACYQRFVDPAWLMLGRKQAAQFVGRASGCFGIPNSLAALLLLLLPATGALALRSTARGWPRGLGLTGLFAFGLLLTISRGGWLALGLALGIWPLVAGREVLTRRLGAAAIVFAGAVAVGVALYVAVPAVHERLDQLVREGGERTRPIMWRGAWQIFRDHPAWGGGAGSYNVRFEQYRPERYQDEPVWAHNDYLNTLADYGVVGFVLFFGAIGVIAWRCRRHVFGRSLLAGEPNNPSDDRLQAGSDTAAEGLDHPRVHQGLAVGLLAFALQLFVDFHLKLPALTLAVAIVGALCVQRSWPASARLTTDSRVGRWLLGGTAIGILMCAGFFVLPHYRAEALRAGARAAVDRLAGGEPASGEQRTVLARARAELLRAIAIDARHAQAWADLSYVLSLWSYEEPAQTAALGREAEVAARRALALTSAVPEIWVRLGVALDQQDRWVEAGEAFVRAYTLAPAAANIRFYYAYHLALRPFTQELALAQVDDCLRLDPAHRPAQVLRQRLATGQSPR